MGEAYRLWTPEQIEVEFDVAGIGSRMLAGLIDQAIIGVALVALVLGMFAVFPAGSNLGVGRGGVDVVLALFVLAIFLVFTGYFAFFEWVWNGQTPGKRVMGLRVIRDGGAPIGAGEAALRNLVRLVDMLPSAYILGITVMLLNRQSKRLGDIAAGTIVVKERRNVGFDRLDVEYPALDAPAAELPEIGALTNEDFLLVRRYFQRRPSLGAAERRRLASQVLRAIGARLVWPPGAGAAAADPERQLALIAAAYRERDEGTSPPSPLSGAERGSSE